MREMTSSAMPPSLENSTDSDIAIVGMQCRFPGAPTLAQFWDNLRKGKESSTFFSERELREAGIREETFSSPNYVRANNIITEVDLFDAEFFDITAQEAEIIDPQQRIFLESAYGALEHAGYSPEAYDGLIGVYAGVGMNTYILKNLAQRYREASSVERYQLMLANDKDFLSTRVSYKLNLKGPSLNINTACSTSLVAVHIGCLSLLNGECDIALAGCVSVRFPQVTGYEYQEGMIFSPDGHCRAFDEEARGTILGDGVGVVVLKRLEDALEDKDTIHAVIKGSAINNDGSLKTGYTAPSVTGQARVISDAQDIAGINPESITYVEAHGTGTVLGDPIEIAGLTEAFRDKTGKKEYCAIGSVKTNIGHLDVAAGMAGLIKTTLMLKHKSLVSSLNYTQPNPEIDFQNSPFYVNTEFSTWETNGAPRRAGVSSFGIGGTNAHVVLEEAPESQSDENTAAPQLIVLSAKTESAREAMISKVANYLKKNAGLDLADVAFTLGVGRNAYPYRCYAVCSGVRDTALTLALRDENRFRMKTWDEKKAAPAPVFVFPCESDPEQKLKGDLYENNAVFREQVDAISELLDAYAGTGVETELTHFAFQYAIAQLWIAYGVVPEYMVGQGPGEYVMAAIAGVCTVEEAFKMAAAHVSAYRDCFTQTLNAIQFNPPQVPYISSLTGTWITDENVTDSEYWLRRMDQEKPIAESLRNLSEIPDYLLIGINASQNLAGLTEGEIEAEWLPAAPAVGQTMTESVLHTLGALWLSGIGVDWAAVYSNDFHRIPLPTYPFERKRYWVEPMEVQTAPVEKKTSEILQRLTAANPHLRQNILVAYVQEEIGAILGGDEQMADSEQKFFDMGLTSLILIELAAKLELELNQSIPPSVFIEYPTIDAFSTMIMAQLNLGGNNSVADPAPVPSVTNGLETTLVKANGETEPENNDVVATGRRPMRKRLQRDDN